MPVGLCGRHSTTTRVRVSIARTIDHRSWRPSRSSSTSIARTPSIFAMIGYPSNVGRANRIASPGRGSACISCIATPVAPAPTTTWSGCTPTWFAITRGRRCGRNSGYRLARPITRSSSRRTDGSGGYGFSLSVRSNRSVTPTPSALSK